MSLEEQGAGRLPLAVTVSGKAGAGLLAHARARAESWRLPFLPRRRKEPLAPLLKARADALLVFGDDGLVLWDQQGRLSFHYGMAALRIEHLRAGTQGDHLIEVAGLKQGDALLDCTLGLAHDALVASHAVGPGGRVVGAEKSLALYAVASEGLAASPVPDDACRVEALHADAAELLEAAPSRSFDCVLFDPMFSRPRKSGGSFDVLRRHADHAPLTGAMLEQARRVARRCVVIKASPHSADLKKLGLSPLPGRKDPRVQWARVDVG